MDVVNKARIGAKLERVLFLKIAKHRKNSKNKRAKTKRFKMIVNQSTAE